MKKLYYLLSLCLAFVSMAMPAYADGGTWTGKSISSVSDAVSSIAAGNYYLMRQACYGWYVTEGNGTLTGTSVTTDNLTGTDLTTAFSGRTYMSSVVYVGGEADAYTFQFKSGNYMGVLNQSESVSTTSDAETFTISGISDLDTYFTIYGSTSVSFWSWESSNYGWNSGPLYLDGTDSAPVGWNVAATSTSSNGCYQFFEVTLEDVDICDVTYTIVDAEGNTIATKKIEDVAVGESFPELETGSYYAFTGYPETTVAKDDCTATLTLTYTTEPTFVSSSIDNATWYGIVTRSDTKYLATNDDNDYIDLSTTWTAAPGSFDAYANVQNNRLWCVIGDPINGFEFYNKYAGKYISMSSTSNGTSATMTSTSGNDTKFDLVYGSGNWFVKNHGSANAYIGDYNNDNPNTLRMWNASEALTGNDAGSIMKFVAADDLTFEAANIPTLSISERVSSFNFWKDGISSMTETGEDLYNAVGSVDVETGKYYQFLGATRLTGYPMYAAPVIDNTASDGSGYTGRELLLASSPGIMNTLFTFEADDTTEGRLYYIKHANSGMYIGEASDNSQVNLPVSKDYATTYEVEASSMPYYWQLKATTNSGERLNISTWSGANVVGYWVNGDEGSQWYIVPVTEIPLVIYDDTQYASATYPFAVELPTGLTAYAVSAAAGTEATLAEIGSQTVPANTPVFITAGDDATASSEDTDAGTKTYALTISSSTDTYSGTNLLSGTTVANANFGTNENYVLASNGTEAVLKNSGTVTMIPANKAYLPANKVSGSSSAQLHFNFGGTDGIGNATTATPAAGDNVYYDLNGRRVLYPVHGVFVKAGGQKVYVK